MDRTLKVALLISLGTPATVLGQMATVRTAPRVTFPAAVDSNSPALWLNNSLVIYNSTGLGPVKSTGANQLSLAQSTSVNLESSAHRPYWIEATWADTDGTVFAWYHHEPHGLCGGIPLTAPEIGALVSYDGGNSFVDLGIILQSGYPIDCSADNGFFAGGHGDFSVLFSRDQKYFYFLFSNYGGPQQAQGVAVARMPAERRLTPVGAVEKYYQGAWNEPGLGGQVSAIFPANVVWDEAGTDAFWGPSVHWNPYLGKWVMLLNHACCETGWPQEGIYVSYNSALSDPTGWSTPRKILDADDWYPQVLGLGSHGTDKLAGHVARLYVGGTSEWEIVFEGLSTIVEPGSSDASSIPSTVNEPESRLPRPSDARVQDSPIPY